MHIQTLFDTKTLCLDVLELENAWGTDHHAFSELDEQKHFSTIYPTYRVYRGSHGAFELGAISWPGGGPVFITTLEPRDVSALEPLGVRLIQSVAEHTDTAADAPPPRGGSDCPIAF